MKITQWHDGKTKPVREGVYQRRTPDGLVVWSKWMKMTWYVYFIYYPNNMFLLQQYESALKSKNKSSFQNFSWRGVKK